MAKFKPVSPQVNFPELEDQVIDYWKKNEIFEKSLKKEAPKGEWTFLDGPPFITGLPHYGTLLSSIPKDVFPRFKTMQGYSVRRVWGWDCHGLPAENKVETKLGLKSKRDIEEKIGVKKFIDECKLYVSQVSSEWEWYVDHIGRWVDFKNAYKTMDVSYMETVMWVFKQLYDKGLIYKGLRVSLYCPHDSTPISNFEVAMDADNYKEVTEPSDTYKYKLKSEENTFLLAWSTTPWNKIVTMALAVNPKLTYVKVKQGQENYILAKSTLAMLTPEPYEIVDEFLGAKLLGLEFEPHYDFYPIESNKKAYIVIPGDFVTADEGTGIVTIAAYGEEDLAVMRENNIQIALHVDEEGKIKPEVTPWAGLDYLEVNEKVNEDLKNRGLLYRETPYTHTVPTCWRCHTRLYYAPQNAWFVHIQSLKDQLLKTNEKINWFPSHFKHGRFQKSVEAAPDWCISRSRYWGSPVPVWECSCGQKYVPGSIKELEELSGKTINDLHKPEIDEITIKCSHCGQQARRVPEVLDSWIEAGSASLAERHYPFNAQLNLESFFPPDFIVEYTGQIRAWFYVVHVIANALFGLEGFKNVLVSGVILGTDGRKMSKNYGNYPDPKEMISKFGGDALRLYLLSTPVMHGEDIRISEEDYRNQVRTFLLTLWNVYSFFVTYANLDDWNRTEISNIPSENILDQWILASLNSLIIEVTRSLENYDTVNAVSLLKKFVEDLSTWYIRRSRDRIGPTASDPQDKKFFYETCYFVLTTFCKLLAPIAPFLSEEIYRNLKGKVSVHLENWPGAKNISPQERQLLTEIELDRRIAEQGHSLRKNSGLKVRQPLSKLTIQSPTRISLPSVQLLKDELNIKAIGQVKTDEGLIVHLETTITPELEEEGKAREIVRAIQEARKKAGTSLDEKITVYLPDWPEKFADYIQKQTLADKLIKSDKFEIKKGSL